MADDTQRLLKGLKYKVRSIKGSLTKFNTFLDNIDSTTSFNTIQVNTRLSKVKELWSEYFDAQMQIESMQEDGSVEAEDESFEENYFNSVARAEEMLKAHSSQTSEQVSRNSENDPTVNLQSQVRLPQIALPSFSGAFEEWMPFHETFHSLIHSNESLSKVQKFHYLRSCLKGEASNCIQELQISANNYDIAWSTLVSRFNNKRLIIKKHIQAIDELPSCTHENASLLRHILDSINKHTRALKALQRPVEHWDDWLIYRITSRLDRLTNKDWESTIESNRIPDFAELIEFLTRKCNTLEVISKNNPHVLSQVKSNKVHKSLSHVVHQEISCPICKTNHFIHQCEKFLSMSVEERVTQVKTAKLCLNCFRVGHHSKQCNSSRCKKCNQKHNTLLHPARQEVHTKTSVSSGVETKSESSVTLSAHMSNFQKVSQVLLSTVMVGITDGTDKLHQCRALLDSGSQSNFISRALVKRLKLKEIAVNIPISGIAQACTRIKTAISTRIKSNNSPFGATISCLVLDNITNDIPAVTINKSHLGIPENIRLADPDFHHSREVDLLIGAELFWQLICVGQIKLPNNNMILRKTQLGWVIAGSLDNKFIPVNSSCNLSLEQTLDAKLTRFWEIEEINKQNSYTNEEAACERHFIQNYKRNSNGRFIVKLPFKEDTLVSLGDSKETARKRFYALERKLLKQPNLKKQYVEFIDEYIRLGHMQPVAGSSERDSDEHKTFYLPHHAVVKNDSLTTKLRVVFDASAKSTTGYSLNDKLMVGPSVQQDLFSIICRFRTHNLVLTADITKMYRQVMMDASDTSLQRILWRSAPEEELQIFELKTVTYGTASASFLATRALQQLAIEESRDLPVAAKISQRDFYVDDLLTGADTISDIKIIFHEVNDLMARGGFELRKWACSDVSILKQLLPNATEPMVLNLDKDSTIKTLGLQWNSSSDCLQYAVPRLSQEKRSTKRLILSQIAQIFDPLGLVGPVIIKPKILMQTLWQTKVSWDETLPLHIHSEWLQYQSTLSQLNEVVIPRNVTPSKNIIELHGFCDASERAYGACIYARTCNEKAEITCELLCSKSRVAPLKHVTIPRLELCAALLLAQLMQKVIQALELNISRISYWSDSTITLAWINTAGRQLKTFVANRVSEIQDITDTSNWHHISTSENPADLLSRGAFPQDLLESQLWWHGPSWLSKSYSNWPRSTLKLSDVEIPDQRDATMVACPTTSNFAIFERYSSLSRLQRIISYCRRFINNSLCRIRKNSQASTIGPLTIPELNDTMNILVKLVQIESFSTELHLLKNGKNIQADSKLKALNPFMDPTGIIRVGGRLTHSQCQYNEKHPIILPNKHQLTNLLIQHVHIMELHAGTQAVLARIRTKYWPLSGRRTVRNVIGKCITCFRARPVHHQPIMGNLPACRVEPARPFVNVGVDYCGPFSIRTSTARRSSTSKAYIAIFICMAVKAVHIELVSSLASDSFLNALKRFIARRGMVGNMYSDNGTNFVKANRELKELHKMFTTETEMNKITNVLSQQGISWHFIPPRAPHVGGLWESAVKSFKYHFRRIVSNALLTFEEFYTVSTQIESILNSRPLIPLSEDPTDLSVLTPGHFLIGDSLRTNLEPNLLDVKLNRLSRLQLLERLKQHFWKRWTKEYLQQLQQRTKWREDSRLQLQIGQLVVLREDDTPPMLWPLGRITAVYPGTDGIIRAAVVRTARGEVKRHANRLCVLPLEQ